MDDVAGVCSHQSADGLDHQSQRLLRCWSPAVDQAVAEVLSFDQLHGDERLAIVAADDVDLDHVGRADARRSPSLGFEARHRLLLAAQAGREDLERDRTVEGDLARLVDHAHAAFAELRSQREVARPDQAWGDLGLRHPRTGGLRDVAGSARVRGSARGRLCRLAGGFIGLHGLRRERACGLLACPGGAGRGAVAAAGSPGGLPNPGSALAWLPHRRRPWRTGGCRHAGNHGKPCDEGQRYGRLRTGSGSVRVSAGCAR